MSALPSLSVPATPTRPTTSRSNSASSVQRPVVEPFSVTQDLMPGSRPRADSSQSLGNSGAKDVAEEGSLSRLRIPLFKAKSARDLRSGAPSPVMPTDAVQNLVLSIHAENPDLSTPRVDDLPVATIFAGPSHKPFRVHHHLLSTKVPHFRKLFSSKTPPTQEQLTYETVDEFSAALLVRWLYGGKLHGPSDFHSMHHYLGLYVLAFTWDVEALCNNVMDLVRAYYRHQSMTAPAFRLEYIYTMTKLPNHMRNFLVATAAFRALCELPPAPGVYLSESIKGVICKNAELAVDFPEALIKLSRNDVNDPRKGDNCKWHEHSDEKYCPTTILEPFEGD